MIRCGNTLNRAHNGYALQSEEVSVIGYLDIQNDLKEMEPFGCHSKGTTSSNSSSHTYHDTERLLRRRRDDTELNGSNIRRASDSPKLDS